MGEEIEKPQKQISRQFFKFDPATSIIMLVAVYFISQIVASLLISLYPSIANFTESQGSRWLSESTQAQFFYVLIAEGLAITMVLWLARLARVKYSRIGISWPKITAPLWAVLAYVAYFICFLVIVMVVSKFLPDLNSGQKQKIGFDNAYTPIDLAMTFISLVILAPVAEEIMFRGFLFSSLRAKYKVVISIIVTSLIFGIAHLQFGEGAPLLWFAAIDTFVLSIFLCLLREKTGNIWASVLLHAIKNLVAFMTLFGARLLI